MTFTIFPSPHELSKDDHQLRTIVAPDTASIIVPVIVERLLRVNPDNAVQRGLSSQPQRP